jgi:hypothetical protein
MKMAQYSDDILDTFIAPELSQLTLMGAPPLEAPPDYLSAAILSYIAGIRYKAKKAELLHLSVVFLKRSLTATNEYRAGRESLIQYVASQLKRQHEVPSYLSALSQFEQCIQSIAQCVDLFNQMNKVCGAPNLAYECNDGSDVERICQLNNAIKHFGDLNRARGASAPVWITNTGIKSREHSVSFDELTENIRALWEINRVTFVEITNEARVRDTKTF